MLVEVALVSRISLFKSCLPLTCIVSVLLHLTDHAVAQCGHDNRLVAFYIASGSNWMGAPLRVWSLRLIEVVPLHSCTSQLQH